MGELRNSSAVAKMGGLRLRPRFGSLNSSCTHLSDIFPGSNGTENPRTRITLSLNGRRRVKNGDGRCAQAM